jgi:hypothetical protein
MYCPKVSNRERNEGCGSVKQKTDGATLAGGNIGNGVSDDVSVTVKEAITRKKTITQQSNQ